MRCSADLRLQNTPSLIPDHHQQKIDNLQRTLTNHPTQLGISVTSVHSLKLSTLMDVADGNNSAQVPREVPALSVSMWDNTITYLVNGGDIHVVCAFNLGHLGLRSIQFALPNPNPVSESHLFEVRGRRCPLLSASSIGAYLSAAWQQATWAAVRYKFVRGGRERGNCKQFLEYAIPSKHQFNQIRLVRYLCLPRRATVMRDGCCGQGLASRRWL